MLFFRGELGAASRINLGIAGMREESGLGSQRFLGCYIADVGEWGCAGAGAGGGGG